MIIKESISDLSAEQIRHMIKDKQMEIAMLKAQLAMMETDLGESARTPELHLNSTEIGRYSRQLILPEIGVKGQEKLKNAAVLIVGAGGLGCPAGQYLAAAGVGVIGVVDHDTVDSSNLHRQILHTEDNLQVPKALSFAQALQRLNSNITCVPHQTLLTSKNIAQIIQRYDVVLDCTDNAATRYLLNDACVKYGKPLVSGSALRWEGQLTVYNYKDGPCYRCIFPKPPKPEAAGNCSDSGVLGCIPGIIGNFQALETIKLLVGMEVSYRGYLLLMDGETGSVRRIKLRNQSPGCICQLPREEIHLIDYVQFCHGAGPHDKVENLKLLDPSQRISCKEYQEMVAQGRSHVLVDVRPRLEMEICSLPEALNIPLAELEDQLPKLLELCQPDKSVVVLCRRGNDSQRAVEKLQGKVPEQCSLVDLVGGLQAWREEVDPEFPVY